MFTAFLFKESLVGVVITFASGRETKSLIKNKLKNKKLTAGTCFISHVNLISRDYYIVFKQKLILAIIQLF